MEALRVCWMARPARQAVKGATDTFAVALQHKAALRGSNRGGMVAQLAAAVEG